MPESSLLSTNDPAAEILFQQLSAYMTCEQTGNLHKAYDFAAAAHSGQKRLSGEDYICHPVGVAYILSQLQMDADSIAAALLHDVVEDTNITLEDIRASFGQEITLLVDGLTKLGKIEYLSKEDQQAENYRKMFLAMAKDIRVVLVKLADRLHNMRTLGYMPEAKQRSTARETLDLFAPLAHRLGIYTIKWELEDLSFKFLQPDIYGQLSEDVQQKRLEQETSIDQAISLLQKDLNAVQVDCRIHGRAKNLYSIYRKMQRDHKELNEIFDLLGIRVLVNTVKDCYGALGVAHTIWKPLPGRFKDYIAMPKSNMYQSLHTTVMSTQGLPLEIQIRTMEMHRIAEYGIAAHWRYKEGGKASRKSFEEKLSWLRQMLEWHKDMLDTKEFVDTVKTDMFTEEEVFVFTPRGDVIDLPAGAVPIDFAYRIHTDVGNRCIGAKVNSRIVPLEYKLSNGDIVEIITSKQANGPSRDWLNIVTSSDSRSKIRAWFKKARRDENILKGRELLERETKRLGYDPKVFLRPERLKAIAVKLNLVSEDNLLDSLGYGGIPIPGVITKLAELYKAETKSELPQESLAQIIPDLKSRGGKQKTSQGILVKGESGLLIRLAKCCDPVPGDSITGYITRGYGVSVHRSDCINVLNNKDEFARLIEVSWNTEPNSLYKATVNALMADKPGVLADVMNITSEIKVNISALNVRTNHRNKTAHLSMELEIGNLSQLEQIMGKMRRLKDVISVERHAAKGD